MSKIKKCNSWPLELHSKTDKGCLSFYVTKTVYNTAIQDSKDSKRLSMSRNRSYTYCLTLNNYEDNDDPCNVFIDRLHTVGHVTRAVVGKEKGESGTPHLQAFVRFKGQVSFSTIKRVFDRAHIERSRGSDYDNLQYCSKEGDYRTYGTFPTKRKVSSHRDVLQAGLENNMAGLINEERYILHAARYDECFSRIRSIQYHQRKFYELWNRRLYKWQLYVLRKLFTQGSRKVLWVHESFGGAGKSFLCRFARYVYGFQLFDGVSSVRDITSSFDVTSKGCLFDVTRDSSDKFSYNTLESVKNGYLFSGKYQGVYKEFDPMPVAVFANVPPCEDRLSADRWDIYNVQSEEKDLASPICQTAFLQAYPPMAPTAYEIPEEEN